jgi:hypothetical protein
VEEIPVITALTQTTPFTSNDTFGVGASEEARKIREVQREAFLAAQRGRALPPHLAVLSPEARVAVDARWSVDICEAMFEYLAHEFPEELLDLVRSSVLPPPALTFAAEIAGKTLDGRAVRAALVPLLHHENALVREGAIYGLRAHTDDKVVEKLRRLASDDVSPGVRQAANDTLDEL